MDPPPKFGFQAADSSGANQPLPPPGYSTQYTKPAPMVIQQVQQPKPPGGVALMLAVLAQQSNNSNNTDDAKPKGALAKKFAIAAIIVTIVSATLLLILWLTLRSGDQGVQIVTEGRAGLGPVVMMADEDKINKIVVLRQNGYEDRTGVIIQEEDQGWFMIRWQDSSNPPTWHHPDHRNVYNSNGRRATPSSEEMMPSVLNDNDNDTMTIQRFAEFLRGEGGGREGRAGGGRRSENSESSIVKLSEADYVLNCIANRLTVEGGVADTFTSGSDFLFNGLFLRLRAKLYTWSTSPWGTQNKSSQVVFIRDQRLATMDVKVADVSLATGFGHFALIRVGGWPSRNGLHDDGGCSCGAGGSSSGSGDGGGGGSDGKVTRLHTATEFWVQTTNGTRTRVIFNEIHQKPDFRGGFVYPQGDEKGLMVAFVANRLRPNTTLDPSLTPLESWMQVHFVVSNPRWHSTFDSTTFGRDFIEVRSIPRNVFVGSFLARDKDFNKTEVFDESFATCFEKRGG